MFGAKGDCDFRSLIWSKTWWNWYLTLVVNFGEVQRAVLAKSTLLTSTLVPLGSFQNLLRSVQMLKREWVQKATGSYRTYSSLIKHKLRFLSMQWKTCLWAEFQPWCLSLQVKDLPLGRILVMILSLTRTEFCRILKFPY